jgi:hypothetical protein
MRRIKAELAQQELEEKQAAVKQVFMTNKGDDAGQATGDPPSQAAHDGDAGKEQGNPPPAADPAMEQLPEIHGGPRPLQPVVPVVHRSEDIAHVSLPCTIFTINICGIDLKRGGHYLSTPWRSLSKVSMAIKVSKPS